jgi:HD-GYP domain-containing protein (c-di-GMP phosphodiesterase class II)
MTGDRVYRQGMPEARALAILERERDSGQWDPHLVDLFVEMVRAARPARADDFRQPLEMIAQPNQHIQEELHE